MIVAIEGMDGSGKTTICEYIEKKYKKNQRPAYPFWINFKC